MLSSPIVFTRTVRVKIYQDMLFGAAAVFRLGFLVGASLSTLPFSRAAQRTGVRGTYHGLVPDGRRVAVRSQLFRVVQDVFALFSNERAHARIRQEGKAPPEFPFSEQRLCCSLSLSYRQRAQ